MKKIPLTQGKFAIVDDEDYEWLMQWKWCFNGAYAVRATRKSNNKRTTLYLHKVIMGTRNGYESDHINLNKLDNRRSNLRFVTRKQNMRNQPSRKNSRSKYKGVWINLKENKWYSEIRINGQKKHLGIYDDEIMAAKAYDIAAKEHHKDHAYLNFPEDL